MKTTHDRVFFGKYRGTVVDNVDPQQRGRLLVKVPDVLGDAPSNWAEPCIPLAGAPNTGMGVHVIPPVQAAVWIEFEQGDPGFPIWVGCRWPSAADVPELARTGPPATPNIVLQTAGKNAIVISDQEGAAGGIMLKSKKGVMLVVNDTGVYLQTTDGGSVVITGNVVNVNGGALKIE